MSLEEVEFTLGSIIQPIEMLKNLSNDALKKAKVIKIYNYLYKFSLERLSQLLHNKTIVYLLHKYIEINTLNRIRNCHNLNKYGDAYIEALNIMIKISKQNSMI